MCGFDSDRNCGLSFRVRYEFVNGEFRPDYSTEDPAVDWEYLREMASSARFRWDYLPADQFAPDTFWQVFLEQFAEEHADGAADFLDRVWPEGRKSRREAMDKSWSRMKTSRHFRGLLRSNRGRMPRWIAATTSGGR
jgi:hypothetical protein